MDKKVDFIIAGAQKGGTTVLASYLNEHADIFMHPRKELHFFDNESCFLGDRSDYTPYNNDFTNAPKDKLWGEATPIYMYWADSMRRIWNYNSQVKLVFILRNPIDRAYSHWNMERSRGADSVSFIDAINTESFRCREALPLQHRVFSYVDRGFYSEQIRRVWRFFPKEQTLILRNEDLRNDLDSTMKTIYDFLKVDANIKHGSKDIHSRSYHSKMSEEEWNLLYEIFKIEIESLESLLDWDCSDWKQFNR